MPHEFGVAETRCEGIEDDLGLPRRGHCWSQFAHGEDFKQFGDIIPVGLVFRGLEGGEDLGCELFSERSLCSN